MQSNAASRIALLRASLSRRRSSARQRSTQWPMRPPRLVIVASRLASGSRRSFARNSIAPSTPVAPRIGKQNAARRPARAALGPRGKPASARTSAIQAGSPLAQTRPGNPSPSASRVLRVACSNGCAPAPGLDAAKRLGVRAGGRPQPARVPAERLADRGQQARIGRRLVVGLGEHAGDRVLGPQQDRWVVMPAAVAHRPTIIDVPGAGRPRGRPAASASSARTCPAPRAAGSGCSRRPPPRPRPRPPSPPRPHRRRPSRRSRPVR